MPQQATPPSPTGGPPSDVGDPDRSWTPRQTGTPQPSAEGVERAGVVDEALEDPSELPHATPGGPKIGSTGHIRVRHHPELG